MVGSQPLHHESSAVQAHLEIVQGIIQRMAENSRSCKVWCVTIVSAVLVLVARTGKPDHALIAVVPTLLLLVLDTYYLTMERRFRNSYNGFVDSLHSAKLTPDAIYRVTPSGSIPRYFFFGLMSFSIWPFYLLVIVTVLLAWQLVF